MIKKNFNIGNVPQEVIIEIAELLVKATTTIPGNRDPSREGIYLTIADKENGQPLLIERIGKCNPEKIGMFHELSLEKGRRLHKNMFPRHISSHQSRDPKSGRFGLWGGAIIAGKFIISVSGLTEELDEAVATCLALRFWITDEEAMQIAKISNNGFIEKLSYKTEYPQ